MLWLNPSALFALAAVAAPILIHILIQRRAERFPFPTLRFLRPTPLAAIRRHLLDDLALVAIRVSLIAAAVAALAGPLLVTAARRQAWDRRIVRAIVVDDGAQDQRATARQASDAALQRTFEGPSLADGIRRGVLWLQTAPPARREILIASPFPIGSITQADLAAIPVGIGVRFERSGTLPATRTVPAGRLLTPTALRAREVTLTGDLTSSRDVAVDSPMAWPIDVVSSKDERPAIDAAIAAVQSQHVWAPPPDRRVRLVFVAHGDVVRPPSLAVDSGELRRGPPKREEREGGRPAAIEGVADAAPIQQRWMANAAERIARDPDLRAAGVRVATGLADARFTAAPWQTLASAADGRPLAAASGSATRLIVASAAEASNVATPVLLRAVANAIADVPDLQRAEVVPIPAPVLQRWSRQPEPVASPRIETVDQDDRRWLWIAALCLLAFETWLRRSRAADISRTRDGEQTRVA